MKFHCVAQCYYCGRIIRSVSIKQDEYVFRFLRSVGSSNKKPVVEATPSRPTFTLPIRPRPKKPSSSNSRPFDKLPQQHAPNTRAPGYTGPLLKGSRPTRPSRPPYRRESTSHGDEHADTVNNSSVGNRYPTKSEILFKESQVPVVTSEFIFNMQIQSAIRS